MYLEHIEDSHIPERWIVVFSAAHHPWLFERYGSKVDFVKPITDWLKHHTENASGDIIPSEWGCENETAVRITFFKKSEAEHFLATFNRG